MILSLLFPNQAKFFSPYYSMNIWNRMLVKSLFQANVDKENTDQAVLPAIASQTTPTIVVPVVHLVRVTC